MAITSWDVDVASGGTGTATGTFDITTPSAFAESTEINGEIVIISRGLTGASLGSPTTHLGLSIGATDGSSPFSCCTGRESGTPNLGFTRNSANDVAALLTSTGALDGKLRWDSWQTNGVRHDRADAFSADFALASLLFAGATMQFKTGLASFSGLTTTGFRPNVVILIGSPGAQPFDDTINAARDLCIGVAVEFGGSIVQRAVTWHDRVTPTHRCQAFASTDKIMVGIDNTPALSETVTVAFSDTGFTLTPTAGTPTAGYIAFAGVPRITCVPRINDTRSSAGVETYSNFGVMPVMHFIIGSMLTAVDTVVEADGAGGMGFGFGKGTNEFYAGGRDDDGGTLCETISNTKTIHQRAYAAVGTPTVIAHHSAYGGDSHAIEYTTVTVARKVGMMPLGFGALTRVINDTRIIGDTRINA